LPYTITSKGTKIFIRSSLTADFTFVHKMSFVYRYL
jgi:hypothetical protein